MSRLRLEQRVGVVQVLGRARLEGHRHRFSKLGRDGTGKGNIESWLDVSVWGVVYELELDQVTRQEVFESGYRRTVVAVALASGHSGGDGGAVRAMTFVASNIVEGLEPSAEYIEHYRVGMVEHGIPLAYQQSLFVVV
jgi:hypothetical protein